MCQATVLPLSIARCPSASTKWLLPVPLGPQTTRTSARSTHSSVRSASGSGSGSPTRPTPRRRTSCRPADPRRGGASGSSRGRGRRPPRRAGRAGPRRAPSAGWSRSRSPPAPLGEHRAAAGASSRSSSEGNGGGAGGLTVITHPRIVVVESFAGRGSVAARPHRATERLCARRSRQRSARPGRSSSKSFPAAGRALQRAVLRSALGKRDHGRLTVDGRGCWPGRRRRTGRSWRTAPMPR